MRGIALAIVGATLIYIQSVDHDGLFSNAGIGFKDQVNIAVFSATLICIIMGW